MEHTNPLGAFLRARREQVRPEDVGITPQGVRRVAGLRREEVAILAGISADYYLRLERGRDRNPSQQVVGALARVLRLDADARAYLEGLAAGGPRRAYGGVTSTSTGTGTGTGTAEDAPASERVSDSVRFLLSRMPAPAFLHGRFFDVLAANPQAEALSPNMAPGANRLLATFLDPAERALYRSWDTEVVGMVAQLRASVGPFDPDPRLAGLVDELSQRSEVFHSLWARHDVSRADSVRSPMHHPQAGDLDLYRDKLNINGVEGQVMVVYHAEPGSESQRKLDELTGRATENAGPTGTTGTTGAAGTPTTAHGGART
ncbi:helix-turn-helix transcriptional regulator [Streptomyces sp. NPDC049954]|uniref:helix-turn-helix transcriptional regulator n=1 Tax=Streptomyces sp. NPDC049954 TaxID=3155779 RepID=UPI00342C19C3